MKKSRILALVLMISILTSFITVPAVQAEAATTLVSVVTGGDMQNGVPAQVTGGDGDDTWFGKRDIVADPLGTAGNNVLFVNGSGSNDSTVVRIEDALTTNKKWYIDAKVLSGASGNVDVFFTDKQGWYDYNTLLTTGKYVNVSTMINASKTEWKRLQAIVEDDGDEFTTLWLMTRGKNDFYVDDLYVYDITNAYTITAPEGVELNTATYADIGEDKMANAGDTVEFTVSEGSTVMMNGNVLTADNGVYSFTMPRETAAITVDGSAYVAPTSLANIACKFGEYQSHDGNATITYPVGEDRALVTPLNNKSGYFRLTPNGVTQGNKYYYSYTAQSTTSKTISMWTSGWLNAAFGYISAGETTQSGTVTAASTQANVLMFGSGNDQTPFKIKDVMFYDITNAHTITAPEAVVLNSATYADLGGDKMANAGDTVVFTVIGGGTVKMNGTELTANNGTYSFAMPGTEAVITVDGGTYVAPTSLTNIACKFGEYLTHDGNAEITYPTGEDRALVTPLGGKTGYFRLTPEASVSGHEYFYSYTAQSTTEKTISMYPSGWSSGSFGYISASETTQSGKATAVSSSPNVLIFGGGNDQTPFYIKDVMFYDITDAHKIAADAGVAINEVCYANIGTDKMTMPGDTVVFTVNAVNGRTIYSVKLNGEVMTPDENGVYKFTMPDGTADITVEYDVTYAVDADGNVSVKFKNAGDRVLIIAQYDSETGYITMVDTMNASTTAADQTVSVVSDTITNLIGTKIFCWSDLDSITPLWDVYEVKQK